MALIGLAVLMAVIAATGIAIAKTRKESAGFPKSRRGK